MIALRNMPTQAFSVLMSLEPAIAALAGFVILSEQLTLLQWSAIGLVIIASVGSSFTPKKAIEMGV
ncbi:MAG: inner membrane transporter RhtA [Shewanella sp.]|jgi:inner membrane transporter RhtA